MKKNLIKVNEVIKVKDAKPGDVLDIPEDAPYLTGKNWHSVQFEYTTVESIGGGWADGMAHDGDVVLYSSESLAEPLILPGDTELEVLFHDPNYDA